MQDGTDTIESEAVTTRRRVTETVVKLETETTATTEKTATTETETGIK